MSVSGGSQSSGQTVGADPQNAGLGSRFGAFLIDSLIAALIVGALLLLLKVGLDAIDAGTQTSGPRLSSETGTESGGSDLVKPSASLGLWTVAVLLPISSVVFSMLIWPFFLVKSNGQTPGKRLFGVRVIREGGAPLDWGTALLRESIGKGLLWIIFPLVFPVASLLCILITAKRRGIHDMLASTHLVPVTAQAVSAKTALQGEPQQPR